MEVEPGSDRAGRPAHAGAGGGEPAAERLEIHRRGQAHRRRRPGGGRSVEITVVDNGIGIPWDERREIFQGFARGEEAVRRGTPGVGLGLAFVRLIARAHKGTIDVHPAAGGGSAFRLRLPAARVTA